jgi:hypothetical protein
MDMNVIDLGKASRETQGAFVGHGDNVAGSDPVTTQNHP